MMMRPSNSGTATCVATSSGLRPSSLSCHCDRELVRHSPCRIGMSSAARCATFQVSSVPPAETAAGTAPPGGKHGRHHRVGRFQQLEHVGLGSAQRGAVHRQCAPTRVFDCAAQCFDVTGVARQLLCPVEEHGDRRAVAGRPKRVRGHPSSGWSRGARNRIRSSARCRTGTHAAGGGSPRRPGPDRRAPAQPRRPARSNGSSGRRRAPARR